MMYKWYDSLKEPTRFLVFFIPAALLIVATTSAPYPFSAIAFGTLLVALVTRAVYIHRGKK
jgi:hypothetical protein